MRRGLTIFALVLLALMSGAFGQSTQLGRRPVHGTPLVFGREIAQFVLLKQTFIYSSHNGHPTDLEFLAYPKNLFIPVSEDREGIFYHAMNGVWERDRDASINLPERTGYLRPGGLYVSKIKKGEIYAYFGDARRPGAILRPASSPLHTATLAQLMIGHGEHSLRKQSSKKTAK